MQTMNMGIKKNLNTTYLTKHQNCVLTVSAIEESVFTSSTISAKNISAGITTLQSMPCIVDCWQGMDRKIIKIFFAHSGSKRYWECRNVRSQHVISVPSRNLRPCYVVNATSCECIKNSDHRLNFAVLR